MDDDGFEYEEINDPTEYDYEPEPAPCNNEPTARKKPELMKYDLSKYLTQEYGCFGDDNNDVVYECGLCSQEIAPPIYKCSRESMEDKHIHCAKCIISNVLCALCSHAGWTRDKEMEEKYDPDAEGSCFLCGYSGNALSMVHHNTACEAYLEVTCPLEDPLCPFKGEFQGTNLLEHLKEEHVNPITFPILSFEEARSAELDIRQLITNTQLPDGFPMDAEANIDEFPKMELINPESEFPGKAEKLDQNDTTPFANLPRLAVVKETFKEGEINNWNFKMKCAHINLPVWHRYNVLLHAAGPSKNCRDAQIEIGFVVAMQHYERSLGLDKFRIAVICLGKIKSSNSYEADVSFVCDKFKRRSKLRVLSALENFHKLPLGCEENESKPVLEIKSADFNRDYSHNECELQVHIYTLKPPLPYKSFELARERLLEPRKELVK